eukprot:1191555-Prorocentrum_minimum.AAC.6
MEKPLSRCLSQAVMIQNYLRYDISILAYIRLVCAIILTRFRRSLYGHGVRCPVFGMEERASSADAEAYWCG